jgi:hypothetical protein
MVDETLAIKSNEISKIAISNHRQAETKNAVFDALCSLYQRLEQLEPKHHTELEKVMGSIPTYRILTQLFDEVAPLYALTPTQGLVNVGPSPRESQQREALDSWARRNGMTHDGSETGRPLVWIVDWAVELILGQYPVSLPPSMPGDATQGQWSIPVPVLPRGNPKFSIYWNEVMPGIKASLEMAIDAQAPPKPPKGYRRPRQLDKYEWFVLSRFGDWKDLTIRDYYFWLTVESQKTRAQSKKAPSQPKELTADAIRKAVDRVRSTLGLKST